MDPETIEQFLRLVRLGAYIDQAAAHAGIESSTVHNYLRRGRRELQRRAAVQREIEQEAVEDRSRVRSIRSEERARRKRRERDDVLLRKQEEPYVAFVSSMDRALAEAEHAMLGVVSRAAAGGAVLSRTVRQNADGTTSTIEKMSEPQWQAAAWRLERKHPERWGRREAVHVDGAVDVGIVDGSARQKLSAMLSRFAATSSDDVDEVDDTNLAE